MAHSGRRMLHRCAPAAAGIAVVVAAVLAPQPAGAATRAKAGCTSAKHATVKATLDLQVREPYRTVKLLDRELVRVESSYQDKLMTVPRLRGVSSDAPACLVSSHRVAKGNKVFATFYVGNLVESTTFRANSSELHPTDAADPILGGKIAAQARISA